MTGEESAIRTGALTRRFGRITALDGLSIDVAPGEVFGLLGPNGAGKSTTIKVLTTLLPATSGRAWVAGFDIAADPRAVRERIGYVPQSLSADGALTGRENLMVSARLYGLPKAERADRIDAALEFVGLADCAGVLAREYSGGMCRRLELAQSLLHRPAVLFLDEPALGLDPVARRAVWEHIRKLPAMGTTVLITTHYMDEAEDLCGRVAILGRGRIASVGTPAELKRRMAVATLDEVFAYVTGETLDVGDGAGDRVADPRGGLREVGRTRRAADHRAR